MTDCEIIKTLEKYNNIPDIEKVIKHLRASLRLNEFKSPKEYFYEPIMKEFLRLVELSNSKQYQIEEMLGLHESSIAQWKKNFHRGVVVYPKKENREKIEMFIKLFKEEINEMD